MHRTLKCVLYVNQSITRVYFLNQIYLMSIPNLFSYEHKFNYLIIKYTYASYITLLDSK